VTDKGVACCVDVKTGDVVWRKRLPEGTYHASLVAGDGKVYFQNIEGACTVVSADDEGKIIATNQLPGTFYATPAISDGVIYLRSYERLYAIGEK
jgi:outer membrane protein assembly factor BamB